jgi:hypothetical protein
MMEERKYLRKSLVDDGGKKTFTRFLRKCFLSSIIDKTFTGLDY